jgi:hypothetical protein
MLHAPRSSHRAIPTENDECGKAMVARPFGVGQTITERVFARQERHDMVTWHVGAQVRDEVPEVVLLGRADRAIS